MTIKQGNPKIRAYLARSSSYARVQRMRGLLLWLYFATRVNGGWILTRGQNLRIPQKSHFPALFESTFSSSTTDSKALETVTDSLIHLTTCSSDIRGIFVSYNGKHTTIKDVAEAIREQTSNDVAALTPLAAYCIGKALSIQLDQLLGDSTDKLSLCIGTDPRVHGSILAKALAAGAASHNNLQVCLNKETCSTPSMAAFCRLRLCQAAVIVTASHLPKDRNGFKFFYLDPASQSVNSFTKADIKNLGERAVAVLESLDDKTLQNALSVDNNTEIVTEMVDWMPIYAETLREAILSKTSSLDSDFNERPLTGLKIVLNSGNGSGGFFAKEVLRVLGADCSASIHLTPDGHFPNGLIPNPENPAMLDQTAAACYKSEADLGIMLDTDSDRSGFVVRAPDNNANYQPLNRNRLIALLGVVLSQQQPGCTIVTDSVTSEGLTVFLEQKLGLRHERYKKGYANVIRRAKELNAADANARAELAIETSGHCALRENDFLDDGTYAAVCVVSLLANERHSSTTHGSILDLIRDLPELDEVTELRMMPRDGLLASMRRIFELSERRLRDHCVPSWSIDEGNLEGIRLLVADSNSKGQFFMLRQSLHDPVVSLQIEAGSLEKARMHIVEPLLQLLDSDVDIRENLDTTVLQEYLQN